MSGSGGSGQTTQGWGSNLSNYSNPNAQPYSPNNTNPAYTEWMNKNWPQGDQGGTQPPLQMSSQQIIAAMLGMPNPGSSYVPGGQTAMAGGGTGGGSGYQASLGADLDPQYYSKWMDQLPSNMPGGGGAVIGNYGAAPWVQNWNTGKTTLNGAQPGSWNQNGTGYYQPYQMMSGGGGYQIPGIGTGPFAFGNPYQQAAQGSNLNINDAYNNARYDQYQKMTTGQNSGAYAYAPQRQDTSQGSPFEGAMQQQGNSAGWTSGDTGPTANQFNGSFQVAPGTESATGGAPPPATPNAPPGSPQWSDQQRQWIQRYGRRLFGGQGWDSNHWQQVMKNNPQWGQQRVDSYWNRLQQRRPEAYDFLKTNQEAIMQNPYSFYAGGSPFRRDMQAPTMWGGRY